MPKDLRNLHYISAGRWFYYILEMEILQNLFGKINYIYQMTSLATSTS